KDKISSGLEQSFAQFFSIYDVVNYGKQIISVATDVNSAFTDLSKVSDATVSDLESKLSDYANLAKDVGATITDTISATSDWARMGYNIPDSQELARVSLIYKNVGDGIDIEEANNSLISTLKGFNLEADDAMSIIDKFNEVSNNFAINSGGIGEALQRSAASFNAANTDLSKSIALITGTNTTLQDPDKVGNMWKTVSARLRGSEVELSEMGEDTDNLITSTSKLQAKVKALTGGFDIMKDQNTYKDIYDIVVGIGEKWQSMTDINRASLLEILAGKNQSNALAAALNNIDVIKKAYETAENSAGSAKKEQDKYEESIQYSIDRIKASCQELAATMADSGMIKGVIDFGNSFVEVLTKIIDKIGILTPLLAGGGIFEFFKNLGKPEIMGFYLLYLHDSEPSRHKKYNIMAL
nr:phage tail tape measure protein [Blautia wexlerae]